MDDKILQIEIVRTLESNNDTAKIVFIPTHHPYKLYEKVSLNYKGISFDGIVAQIDENTDGVTYTLAAPSVLLTRGECDISLEGERDVVDAVLAIVPDDFTVEYDGDETYENTNSRGQVIMDVIKDIATSVGKDVYVDGWKIVFDKRAEPTGREVTLNADDVEIEKRNSIGGTDFFTKVKGYFYDEDEDVQEYAVDIYSDVAYSTVDIIDSEEEGIDSFDKLKKQVEKRVDEIKSSAFSKNFRLLKPIDIRPFDVIVLNNKKYKVTEVRYRFGNDGFSEEVTAYETT